MTTRWDVADAVVASDLTPMERLVMLVLAKRCDDDPPRIPARFSPSLTRLQSETGLSRSSLAKQLSNLEAAGWIVRTRPGRAEQLRDKARTAYALHVPRTSAGDGLVHERDEASPRGDGASPPHDRTSPRDVLSLSCSSPEASSLAAAAAAGESPQFKTNGSEPLTERARAARLIAKRRGVSEQDGRRAWLSIEATRRTLIWHPLAFTKQLTDDELDEHLAHGQPAAQEFVERLAQQQDKDEQTARRADDEAQLIEHALKHECPYCEAPSGTPCISYPGVHMARRRLVQVAS